jgi:hypothetical protein
VAYRLRYQAWVDWVTPGMGLGIAASPTGGPGMVPAGNAQTIAFFNGEGNASGTTLPPTSTTFTDADVATLTNAMAADLLAQMEVPAVLTRIQNFSTGTG